MCSYYYYFIIVTMTYYYHFHLVSYFLHYYLFNYSMNYLYFLYFYHLSFCHYYPPQYSRYFIFFSMLNHFISHYFRAILMIYQVGFWWQIWQIMTLSKMIYLQMFLIAQILYQYSFHCQLILSFIQHFQAFFFTYVIIYR